jgi:hypothetical protein
LAEQATHTIPPAINKLNKQRYTTKPLRVQQAFITDAPRQSRQKGGTTPTKPKEGAENEAAF